MNPFLVSSVIRRHAAAPSPDARTTGRWSGCQSLGGLGNFSGRVSERRANDGENISSGSPLVFLSHSQTCKSEQCRGIFAIGFPGVSTRPFIGRTVTNRIAIVILPRRPSKCPNADPGRVSLAGETNHIAHLAKGNPRRLLASWRTVRSGRSVVLVLPCVLLENRRGLMRKEWRMTIPYRMGR